MRSAEGKVECRKMIAFDLVQAQLEQHYPRPDSSKDRRYFKRAYKDIKRFMRTHGFIHRQYSAYVSKDKLGMTEIYVLIREMSRQMPWLAKCVGAIDVADINERQFSLIDILDSGAGKTNGNFDISDPETEPIIENEKESATQSLQDLIKNAENVHSRQIEATNMAQNKIAR